MGERPHPSASKAGNAIGALQSTYKGGLMTAPIGLEVISTSTGCHLMPFVGGRCGWGVSERNWCIGLHRVFVSLMNTGPR